MNKIVEKVKIIDAESFDLDTALNAHNITRQDLDNFREISRLSNIIPKAFLPKAFLVILIACENNKDKAFNLLNSYCTFKKEMPEFFSNRNVESDEIQQVLKHQIFASLPSTPKNYNLLIHKLSNFDPKNYFFDASMKTYSMVIGN